MNLEYLRLELTRLRRDPVLLLIVIVLPACFFIGAGVALPPSLDAGEQDATRNAVLMGLACYGAATAASTITGQSALERVTGWARQLGLTPLPTSGYLAVKASVALVAVSASVLVMFVVALVTGVRLGVLAGIAAGIVVIVGSATWALYGLVVALAFRSQSALAASAAGLVLLALGGGVFVPLPEHLVSVAQWTPMYGHAELARAVLDVDLTWGAIGIPLLNWVAWTSLLAVLATRLVLRSRRRG